MTRQPDDTRAKRFNLHLAALAGCLTTTACGGTTVQTKVTLGADHAQNAEATMGAEGVVFAPFEMPMLGAEETQLHYRCIGTVNRAIAETLGSRYVIHAAPPDALRRQGVPRWARGPGGRVAVHVESFRCGLVVGDAGYAMAASDDPGGLEEIRGVVVIAVHDRWTGEVVIRVRAEATAANGLSAARAAAVGAAEQLLPPP